MSRARGGPARRLVIATGNRGKLLEFRAILAGRGIELLGLDELAPVAFPEEGDDYTENAVAKARAAAAALGAVAVADDSGLEVDGLGGGPGPYAARFGGAGLGDADRNALLLARLAGAGRDGRRARYVCVVAHAQPDGTTATARGECQGYILEAPRGGAGFGYDPIFEVEGEGRAMAELDADHKNRISHRARALRALCEQVDLGAPLRAVPLA